MYETKVRLSLVIPGNTMISSQDCDKMSNNDAYNKSSMEVKVEKRKGKKVFYDKEYLHIYTRKTIPARQLICISKESYDYMLAYAPTSKLHKGWNNISKKQRLNYHFQQIAESLNAISFNYEILDD